MNVIMTSQTLIQLRKNKGITQRNLASKLGVNLTTIKNWESGNSIPDSANICALADFYHVTTDYLFGRSNEEYISIEGIPSEEADRLRKIAQTFIDSIPDRSN